jgi:transcriptional regulator with XRE-family HTH domain
VKFFWLWGVIAVILNQRLRSLRMKSCVTQKNIAEAIGVTIGNLQKFEYGTARPKLENMIKLADFFNVSLDYLVGRTDNPSRL